MNSIVMYLLIMVAVVVVPGSGEGPGIKTSRPLIYPTEAGCREALKKHAMPALKEWADSRTQVAVVAAQGDCLPVQVPFSGQSS